MPHEVVPPHRAPGVMPGGATGEVFVSKVKVRSPNLEIDPGQEFPPHWSSREALSLFASKLVGRDATWRDVATLRWAVPRHDGGEVA